MNDRCLILIETAENQFLLLCIDHFQLRSIDHGLSFLLLYRVSQNRCYRTTSASGSNRSFFFAISFASLLRNIVCNGILDVFIATNKE